MSVVPKKKTGDKMKAGFWAVIKAIKSYSEYYFAIVSVLGVIWGGFVMYDNWRDNNKLLQTNVKTIIETQFRQGKIDSVLLMNQSEMRTQLNTIESTTSSI